ncbi:CD225/dispanin family protein [Arenimonas caeni]|jgi:hypothetical protein|uniref:CD225/dispanin family protein n=1 Tax=Arenimonas caeni TaxID=2058085 RepID=UPI002A36A2D7|nr:CD225/dispanin family protein [Arenimonas caeni]MDY0023213.1 CD225/dispanin family protein [Arenimonas caeni]
MNCTNCGHLNADGATVCASCGAALGVAPPSPPPAAAPAPAPAYSAPAAPAPAPIPNNLVWAILATLCCCLPTGIVAIVFAAQVDGKAAAGDYDGARKASENAKLWSWISLGLGLLGSVGYFGLAMIGAIADAGNY